MKTGANILLLVILFLPIPIVSLYKLFGNTRNVIVQIHHDHGAVIIGGKKVRVPYTMQETAISTQPDGLGEFLFLDNYQMCFVTALIQSVMGLLLIFIYYVNTVESTFRKYRILALKVLFWTIPAFILTEIGSHYIYQDWITDVKNGINGNSDLFGVNATFPNANSGSLGLDYQPNIYLYVIPLIALAIVIKNARSREEQIA